MFGVFRTIAWRLARIDERIEEMAQGVDELRAEIAKLQQTESDTATRVQGALTDLQTTIDDLRAHPAAEDLTDEIASLETVNSALQGISPAQQPAPTPDPNPTPGP